MCAFMNLTRSSSKPLKTQISDRARRLIDEHELVIPEGVKYHVMPKGWWAHLRALEDAIWPFAIVMCRVKPIPSNELVDRVSTELGPVGLSHLARKIHEGKGRRSN